MKVKTVIAVVASMFVVSFGMAILGADHDRPGQIKQSGDNDNDHGNGNGNGKGDEDDQRIAVGFGIARDQGITLNLQHKKKDLVGLGSYLVNAVGGCNDCHTAPSYSQDPFAGLGAPKQINIPCYLAGGTAFGPPPFGLPPASPVSRDITPWENGKPAGLTFDEFKHVIRTGEDPDNPGQVLRVMPWPVYQTMTDHDLRAIYEFLSAIPAINPGTCGVPSVS